LRELSECTRKLTTFPRPNIYLSVFPTCIFFPPFWYLDLVTKLVDLTKNVIKYIKCSLSRNNKIILSYIPRRMTSCRIIEERGCKYEHSVKEAPDILTVFLVYFQTHTNTQAPKQTHVRMEDKYTRTSSQNDRHPTEKYFSFAVLSYLTV
jgi:hypothetical protein